MSNDTAMDIKPDIKPQIKQEPDIKQEQQSLSMTVDMKPPHGVIKPENIKKEVKEEPDADHRNNSTSSQPSGQNQLAKKPEKGSFKVTFTPEQLKTVLEPLLMKLYNKDEAAEFRVPVDTVRLNIPDYFQIIKTPMDLSTIKIKLDNGEYSDPWQFIDDVWLMFENAWLYNRKPSKVYKCCTKVSERSIACNLSLLRRNI